MEAPDLDPCAQLVRTFDPDLFATALFAPEPGRGRLLTLYAYDIELSRAAEAGRGADTGPLIAAMRLQFWRDTVERAGIGASPPAHDVAGPLAVLVAEGRLDPALLLTMAEAREADAPGTLGFDAWADARFGALVQAALAVLGTHSLPGAIVRPAGRALALAFALRHARAMAGEGLALVPDLAREDLAPLARGERRAGLLERVRAAAETGLAALAEARAPSRSLPSAARPALLPLWRAGRDLRRAARDPGAVLSGLPAPSGTARSVGLTWAALTGRW